MDDWGGSQDVFGTFLHAFVPLPTSWASSVSLTPSLPLRLADASPLVPEDPTADPSSQVPHAPFFFQRTLTECLYVPRHTGDVAASSAFGELMAR